MNGHLARTFKEQTNQTCTQKCTNFITPKIKSNCHFSCI